MAEQFDDQVNIRNEDGDVTITLDANDTKITVGDRLKPGNVQLIGRGGTERIRLDASGSVRILDEDGNALFEFNIRDEQLILRDTSGNDVLRFINDRGSLAIGTNGNDGHISIHNQEGTVVFKVNGQTAETDIGNEGNPGVLRVADEKGKPVLNLDGKTASLSIGEEENGGSIKLLNQDGGMFFHVSDSFGRLRGGLTIGGRDQKGDLQVTDQIGRTAIYADGGSASFQLGNLGNAGDLILLDNDAKKVFQLDGLTSTAKLGGNGKPGHLIVVDDEGNEVGRLSGSGASLHLGNTEKSGEIFVSDNEGKSSFSVDGANSTVVVGSGNSRIVLDGQDGDIQLPGADCAEEFEIINLELATPGTVMIAMDESRLAPCTLNYDCRVAGVVSGAEGYRPGIVLNKAGYPGNRKPIALSGRVYCKVEASEHSISIGDLLTTSSVPGHAKRAHDRDRAYGAVLGKALAPMDEGRGLIPVLVALL